ncbi:hypothetical protein J6590_005761 [Homalodisca vitripennis]|nr:hypothetical protein J6590_005761 [Homalodisca vitripennis]
MFLTTASDYSRYSDISPVQVYRRPLSTGGGISRRKSRSSLSPCRRSTYNSCIASLLGLRALYPQPFTLILRVG